MIMLCFFPNFGTTIISVLSHWLNHFFAHFHLILNNFTPFYCGLPYQLFMVILPFSPRLIKNAGNAGGVRFSLDCQNRRCQNLWVYFLGNAHCSYFNYLLAGCCLFVAHVFCVV